MDANTVAKNWCYLNGKCSSSTAIAVAAIVLAIAIIFLGTLELIISCSNLASCSMTSNPIQTEAASRKQTPLRWLLIVPFVVQIFTAVGLVGYFSFRNGQKAVDDLAEQLMDKASQQVGDHLSAYLALPQQINQLNTNAIATGQLDLTNLDASGKYFWQQSNAFKDLSYVGLTLTNGDSVGAGRWIQGVDVAIFERSAATNRKGADYASDAIGKRVQLLQTYDFDGRSLVWYTDTVKAGKPIWTQIYAFEPSVVNITMAGNAVRTHDPSLGVDNYVAASANRPIYDQHHKLLGVLSIDLLLTDISKFLQALKVSAHGQVFLVERNGLLIGNSGKSPLLHKVNGSTERYSAIASPDPLIRTIAQALQNRYKTLQAISTHQELKVDFKGDRQYVQVTPWRDQYGLDWLVVVTIPESDFMSQITANTRITITLCLAALILAVISSIYTSQQIVQAILQLSQASEAIANGQIDQWVKPSRVKELGTLAQSFNRMAQQLRELFTNLAQTNEKLAQINEQLETRVEERTSELKNTLQELQNTQAQMIQAEKMSSLGQLVAGVAHEINNPVNFIHGNVTYVDEYTQRLLELAQLCQTEDDRLSPVLQAKMADLDLAFLNEDLPKVISSMYMGTERIRTIVQSLRTFSRLDESEMKAVDIHEGIDSTLLILQHRLKETPSSTAIALVQNYGNLPRVECYPGQLNQVLMNILTNAIDALEELSDQQSKMQQAESLKQITIRTRLINPAKPNSAGEEAIWEEFDWEKSAWVEIAIADNGIGMSESVCQHLFDPFFTTKPVGKGTGMGMSISYKIITEKHGGKLECLSTPGIGTEFLIQIPMRQIR